MHEALAASRCPILNTTFNNLTLPEVLAAIRTLIPQRRSAAVVELNTDVIMKIEADPELKRMVGLADLSLIDGKPLVWILRSRGITVKEKISGSDLMPHVCEMAAAHGFSVFILGGTEENARKAGQNLRKTYPQLDFRGSYSPPLGFEKDPAECQRILQLLEEKDPDILFLCFGCPKQEKWWLANYQKLHLGVCLCAGASVDFMAGAVKRAPRWMSEHGLEWFFRFLMEPKRLFRRYFIDDVQIVRLIMKYR